MRQWRSAFGVIPAVAVAACILMGAETEKPPTEPVKTGPLVGAADAGEAWPLAAGNLWVYEGTVETAAKDGETAKCNVRAKMRVRFSRDIGGGTLYMMEGRPADAVWFVAPPGARGIIDVPPSRYGLLVLDNCVFQLDQERADKMLAALGEGAWQPTGLVTATDLILDFPLVAGKRFGDLDGLTRPDRRYCWCIDKEVGENAPLARTGDGTEAKGMLGVPASPFKALARLRYYTLPEEEAGGFTAGVGITEYCYSHHGSVGEARLRLTTCWLDGQWYGTPPAERDRDGAPPDKAPGAWVQTLETTNYIVTVRHLCEEEGHVSCDRMLYHGVAKKSGKEITLMGSTWHTMGADGTAPSRLLGYRFKNGDVTYIVQEDGTLRVVRGDAEVLVEEKGKWQE